MKRYRKVTIYPEKGKTNIGFCREKSGCYLIYKGDKLRYIGMSGTDLYKTITRHFQSWNDRTQVRTTYPQDSSYKISIVLCSPSQAGRLERYLIVRMQPVDNPDKLRNYTLNLDEQKAGQEMAETYVEDIPF